MGIFNFLKKSKEGAPKPTMELPPVPEMEGVGGFPELPKDAALQLPEEALPPLPQNMGMEEDKKHPEAPVMPETPMPEPPGMPEGLADMPPVPGVPKVPAPTPMPPSAPAEGPGPAMLEPKGMPPPAPAEFPAPTAHPSTDIVPNKIPPLEGVPEPPELGELPMQEVQKKKPEQELDLPAMPGAQPPADMKALYEEVPEERYTEMREKKVRRAIRGPLFLKADSVKDILENTEEIRASFRGEDDIFFRINEIKSTQDKKFEKLRQTLEDVQRKLIFIDRSLFEVKY